MSERCKDDLPVDIKVTYGYFLVGAAPLILVDTIDSKLLVFLSSPCSCIKCKFLAHSMMNTFNVVSRYDLTVFINSSSFLFFSLSLSHFFPLSVVHPFTCVSACLSIFPPVLLTGFLNPFSLDTPPRPSFTLSLFPLANRLVYNRCIPDCLSAVSACVTRRQEEECGTGRKFIDGATGKESHFTVCRPLTFSEQPDLGAMLPASINRLHSSAWQRLAMVSAHPWLGIGLCRK